MPDDRKLDKDTDRKLLFPKNYAVGAAVAAVIVIVALIFLLLYFRATPPARSEVPNPASTSQVAALRLPGS